MLDAARGNGHYPQMTGDDTAGQTPSASDHAPFVPRRELGRTGFRATVLGIGDLADRAVPFETCVSTARLALSAGLNVIDTAPAYEDGYSEEIVGAAIRDCRDRVFLIDKIDHHDAPVAPQVDGSLQRLGTDHADLFVFHGLSQLEAWDRVAGPGGGMEQLADCVAAGKVRYRGLSSHDPATLECAILSKLCDVVMFPVGPWCDSRYIDRVLPLARERGVGTVCFKTFGAGKLLGDTAGYGRPLADRPRGKLSSGGADASCPTLPHLTVEECVHYTLTCDPDVTLLGMSFPNEVEAALAAARRSVPLRPATLADIRARAEAAVRDKGPCWWNPDRSAI